MTEPCRLRSIVATAKVSEAEMLLNVRTVAQAKEKDCEGDLSVLGIYVVIRK